jgi:hypothetical protein
MLRKNRSAVLAVCALSMLFSCAKEGPTGPTGPPGPYYTGNLTGFVSLYDKYGSQVLSGYGRTLVYLTGPNYGPAIPNNRDTIKGQYTFTAIKTGTYTLSISDSSINAVYAATKIQDINFVSGTFYQDVKMSAIPNQFIAGFASAKSAVSAFDSLAIYVTPEARDRNCIVFVGSNNGINSGITSYLLHYVVPIPANSPGAILLIPGQDLANAGLVSGKMAYYAAYSYVVNDASVYEDISYGKNVYNAVNDTSWIDSAIVP